MGDRRWSCGEKTWQSHVIREERKGRRGERKGKRNCEMSEDAKRPRFRETEEDGGEGKEGVLLLCEAVLAASCDRIHFA